MTNRTRTPTSMAGR
uniref:Uncharacterized protein n=1 Tax=Anopheles quadriannulatus TaxID=34691 RepID=A0A904A5Y2_ANOQN